MEAGEDSFADICIYTYQGLFSDFVSGKGTNNVVLHTGITNSERYQVVDYLVDNPDAVNASLRVYRVTHTETAAYKCCSLPYARVVFIQIWQGVVVYKFDQRLTYTMRKNTKIVLVVSHHIRTRAHR